VAIASDKTEQFQYWLADMDHALERFMSALPKSLRDRLDYSPQSLNWLEAWYLTQFPTFEATRDRAASSVLDACARYVGETIRRRVGGTWFVSFADHRNAFHGLPQLGNAPAYRAQCCPLTLVTAAADRRTGNYWSSVVAKMDERDA
jgi:hypothetical protein